MSQSPPQVSPPWSTPIKMTVGIFGVVVVGSLLLRFQAVIPPLVTAFLIAYIITPVVNFVSERTRVPRGMVTGAIYLLFFGIVALAVSLLTPPLVRQAFAFQLDFRRISDSIEQFLSRPLQIGLLKLDLARGYDEIIATLGDMVQPLATQTVALVAEVVSTVVEVIFIGIVSFYLTKDGPAMGRWLAQWVPPALRYDFDRLLDELDGLWRAFFRGQLLLALTMGTIIGVLMGALGMRNALILAILAFLLEFLPSVGHGIWLSIAIPLALFQGSEWLPLPKWGFALLVLGVHVVLQQVDLNYLIPRIVGRKVHLHPMVVIIGIIVGGILAGVLGMLLAAPSIASLGVLMRYVHRKMLDLPPWPEVEAEAEEPAGDPADE